MSFHFCPKCGTKLQPDFLFCPSCGEKLPAPAAAGPNLSSSKDTDSPERPTCAPVCARPPLGKTRKSFRLDREVDVSATQAASNNPTDNCAVTPGKQQAVTFNLSEALGRPAASPSPSKSPARAKAKALRHAGKQAEEGSKPSDKAAKTEEPPLLRRSAASPPAYASPKGKAKKAKRLFAVEPLEVGEEVTDTIGRKWKLEKLLGHHMTELLYKVDQASSRSRESDHVLKLGAKDGRIFNELNFLQRAAKPAMVHKWKKRKNMSFLGIPSCFGFGLHSDSYRFLIFPDMGRSLQSVIKEEECLSETDVLHLACSILDVLEYLHSNEYVHADIRAENVYIKPQSQVYLTGYCHSFRYRPCGQHVQYHEASRTPHEGAVEFISLDAHKGAAPSRRSDLQTLGYCMLRWHTGPLPWSDLTRPESVAAQKQRYLEDVPALLLHCFGRKKVSTAFEAYLTKAAALQYSEEPDYGALKAGLSAALLQLGGAMEQPLSF
ncbi:serine/threonine-protein kinase VRK3 [Genypterus blacodes]|uniref:serine/threonine-protein kinase VRK3 n=1 Tax=Genypterus blacodes TaxID=154954 RepID=UPI003F76531D